MKLNEDPYLLVSVALVVIAGICFLHPHVSATDNLLITEPTNLQLIGNTTLLPIASPPIPAITKEVKVIVTAYSSCPFETDDTPFITASGKHVEDGIVANNMLKFGQRVRLPELYGDKIFVVQDRMHSRKSDYHVDIWFESKQEAIQFGVERTVMEILQN